ncbi:MAG: hypothetical protein ACK4GN_02940 [Runella sp.]
MTQNELIALLDQLIKINTSPQRSRNNIASDIAKSYLKASGATVPAKLIYDIDENYNKEGLIEWAKYARKMLNENKEWIESLNLRLPYELLNTIDLNTASKAKLVWAIAFLFSQESIMKKFLLVLPHELKQAFEHLTWIPEIKSDVLSQLINTHIVVNEKSGYSYNPEIKPAFKILSHQSSSWNSPAIFRWPPSIREFFQGLFPRPAYYLLNTIDTPPSDLMYWEEGETIIFEEIQKLMAYRLQDAISVNTSGKVAANAFKKMRKMLAIKEFYADDESFGLLRTLCLAQILASYTPSKNQVNLDSSAILKELRKTLNKNFKILFLLNDLKNHGHVGFHYYNQEAEKQLVAWMERLPLNQWVSIENIQGYTQIHSLNMKPASQNEYSSLAYEVPSLYGSHTNKINITSTKAYSWVEHPALLGSFFLMASLGWLDIAYEVPKGVFGKDYFSSFEGLRYVRLNDLGGYIFGRKTEYTPKVNKSTQELIFDDQSLLIFCDPENTVAETILANYAERVSPTRFRVTNYSFLKDCKSKQQLLSKITLFNKSIAPHLPDNWHAFFDDLMAKADPLTLKTDLNVFSIPSKNQALIRLMAQDEVLKTIVIKAEGFRVLVNQSETTKFKNRLKELGYLI